MKKTFTILVSQLMNRRFIYVFAFMAVLLCNNKAWAAKGGTYSASGDVLTIGIDAATTVSVRANGSGNFTADYTFVLTAGIWAGSGAGNQPNSAGCIEDSGGGACNTVAHQTSTARFPVTATILSKPYAPSGTAKQTYSAGTNVASLLATGSSIKWYDVPTCGTALVPATVLVNGTKYCASQTISCTESASRFEVTVTFIQ